MMGNQRRQRSCPLRCRVVLLSATVLLSLVLLVFIVIRSGVGALAQVGTVDYYQYWSAARLLLGQRNPYDPELMLMMERAAGYLQAEPIMMWNPPWALALALPFALLPFPIATFAWLLINMLLSLLCGALLWRVYAPDGTKGVWVGLIITALYIPIWMALRMGQLSPWLLVGVTGILLAIRAERDFLAGTALSLLSVKPHVVYLLLFGIAWWVLRTRRWRVFLGAAAAVAAACVLVWVISPQVFPQYLAAAAEPPLYWRSATLGTWLRTLFGAEHHWLQFLPAVAGVLAFIVWAVRYRGAWDLPALAPGLLLASTVTAVYGWGFDQVTLLPVVIALFAGMRKVRPVHRLFILGTYILAQIGLLVQTQLFMDSSLDYWFPCLLAVLYTWQQHHTHNMGIN